jgi:hypothetical protein
VHRGKKAVLFDDIVGTRQRYRPDAQTKQRHEMRAAWLAWLEFGRHSKKNLRRPTEVLFGPLVLDWRGDSLRLVN